MNNEEFIEMNNKTEEVSTRAKIEAQKQKLDNKQKIFIKSVKVVTECKPVNNNSFVKSLKNNN